ncbi:MAG: hypothetical protein WD294_01315 [Phycisphaeraceae bacterium]
MRNDAKLPGLLLMTVLALTAVGLGGCGEGGGEVGLWDAALMVHQGPQIQAPGRTPAEAMREVHASHAGSLDRALDRYPDAPEGLRRVIAEIRDGKQQMADGAVTGSDATALMEQHDEYWSYLEKYELPPDYR